MIGIMDWGIGGLSVYHAIRERGLTCDILYFSDSGATPYGKLSREALRERFRHIASFFAERNVSRVLVACHAASSALDPEPMTECEQFGGVALQSIIPAAVRVARQSGARRLGVIGGLRTIDSGVYVQALAPLDLEPVFCPAQPLSAFVEAGELDSPEVEQAVRSVFDRLQPIDSLLIACTHYPALAPVFRRIAPGVVLLDPGAEMTASIREEGASGFEFHTTGDRAASARAARLGFDIEIG